MDERNREYLSENMDDELRTQTLGETRFQDQQFGSQSEVIPPRKTYTSLWLFAETNPFRMRCKAIVVSKPFDYFILLTIFANCILLAMNTPLPHGDKSITNERIESAEIYLLVIFGFECILKIIAFGFMLHPGSYLRSGWNMLDFVVVVTGFMSLPELNIGINAGSLKALRAARVLRPLKLVSGIPSLQVVMKSIMCAISPLLQICLLVGFVVVLYAIIGLQFLNGSFHYVCVKNGTTTVPDEPQICAAPGKGGLDCKLDQKCEPLWEGPNDGITNFDNIFLGMLTVFQVITNEGWTDIMYWTFDALDNGAYIFWFLYYSLVVIGSFFMLNLVLGVLSGEFAKERERVENRKAFLKVRRSEQVERQVTGYLDWLSKAEDILMEEEENGDEGTEYEKYEGGVAMTSDVLARRRHKTQKDEGFWKNFLRRNKRWRVKVRHMVKHDVFYWTIIMCVFLNTVSVSLLHYRQPDWLTQMQDTAETIFLTFFFLEMCLKIYGLGFQIYFNSQFNRFDFVIVWCSIIEYILSKAEGMNLGISVLRALRLLRLFKFTRYWSSLRNLITSLLGSIKSILSLLFLLFLFIVIFALLGMQLFGAQFKIAREENPRTNFDDFWNAMLSVFQILTGEDWNALMYDGVVASGGPHSVAGLGVSLYFVLLVVLGNYTLLNVFLAIAVDNLANAQQLNEDEEAEEQAREDRKKEIKAEFERRIRNNGHATNTAVEIDGRRDGPREDEFEQEDDGDLRPATLVKTMKNPERIVVQTSLEKPIIDTKTFFLFSPTNRIRIIAHKIVNFKHFDNGILVCILISSVLLACENVVNEEAQVNKVLMYCDYVFTTIFAFEVVVKMIDYGVLLHKGSYLRDSWNFIDALVVSSAIASLVLASSPDSSPSAQKVVKLLRVLRVLRPLKAVNKSKNLKAVFQCIVFSLKNVMNILLITILFLFIFACIGVQLFQGKFFGCTDASKMTEEECQGTFYEYSNDLSDVENPKASEREWSKQDWHFDNVLFAMSTLFASSTGEGWPAVMQAAIDATDIDRGPIVNNQIEVALYFILFVVIFSFFFINIFVALIILTFQDEKEKEQGDCELERNQRDCLHIAIIKKPIQRFMPDNPNSPQYRVWQIVDSAPFEYFIMLLIVLNTLTMMMKYYNEPATYRTYLNSFNEVFTFLFTLEAVLKLYVFRRNYFRDGWNCFDFVIVLGSLVDFIITHGSSGEVPFDVSMFRIFRAARLVKLLKRGYTIRILLWTFLQSFKSLPYVGIMIGLLFFIYAIIGMQLFGKISIKMGEDDERSGSDIWTQITYRNNFRSFFPSIQVLFRAATGENWHYIMLACTSDALCTNDAVPDKTGETCGSDIAYLYFISFVFLCSFLMLNLFVAVIMDNFEYLTRDESILGPHHLDEFVRVWAEFDPAATGRIKHTEVCQLLRQMVPPVGIGMKCPKIVAYKRLIKMNMPLDADGTVEFTATLFALVRTALGILTDNNNLKKNDKEMQGLLKRVWPKLTKNTLDKIMPKPPRDAGTQQMTVGKIYCAKLIYENYKFLKRKGDTQDGGNILGRFVGGNGYRNVHGSQDIERNEDIPMRSLRPSVTPTDTTSHRSLPPSLLSQSRHSRTSLSSSPVPRAGSAGDSGVSENGYHPNMNQHIAMAIRSGKSPYAIYGLQEVDDGDDWC